MSVAGITEPGASSKQSCDAALHAGPKRATRTLRAREFWG